MEANRLYHSVHVCPHNILDPLSHHAVTIEVGSGLGHDPQHTRPADVLLPNWICSQSAALDFSVVSLLNSTLIHEAGTTAAWVSCFSVLPN